MKLLNHELVTLRHLLVKLSSELDTDIVLTLPEEVKWEDLPEERLAHFVFINGELANPVYLFWRLRHEKRLAKKCHVVFYNVEDSPAWEDLRRAYGGVRFGSLFILACMDTEANPPILPSQKGLYMK